MMLYYGSSLSPTVYARSAMSRSNVSMLGPMSMLPLLANGTLSQRRNSHIDSYFGGINPVVYMYGDRQCAATQATNNPIMVTVTYVIPP